jgi:hypothetical protein
MSAVRHPADPLGWMVVPSVSATVWQPKSRHNHPFVILIVNIKSYTSIHPLGQLTPVTGVLYL